MKSDLAAFALQEDKHTSPLSPAANLNSPCRLDGLGNARRFVSSNDLAADEDGAKPKHKKSSSFSDSPFPADMVTDFKRHRKTRSESERKNQTLNHSSSLTYSTTSSTTPRSTNTLTTQRTSLLAQMYHNGGEAGRPFNISKDHLRSSSPAFCSSPSAPTAPAVVTPSPEPSSAVNLPRVLSLFVLVLLVLSGFLFTPR